MSNTLYVTYHHSTPSTGAFGFGAADFIAPRPVSWADVQVIVDKITDRNRERLGSDVNIVVLSWQEYATPADPA